MRTRSTLAFVTVALACSSQLARAQAASLASVAFQMPTVTGGTTVTAVITLTAPAGPNGLDVALSITSSVARLASAGVTIGSGLTAATVSIATTPTPTQQVATLTASARGESRSASLTVVAPSVSALAVTPGSVVGGSAASATVTLSGAAPPGGTVVTLTHTNPSVTSASSVTVQAGQTTASYSVGTSPVTATTSAVLSAAAGGTTQSTSLTIARPVVMIASIGFRSHPVASGMRNDIRVFLDRPAPPGGVVVQLSVSDSGIVQSMPAADTIPPGADFHDHSVVPALTATDRPFGLTASLGGLTKTARDTLRAPRLSSVSGVSDSMTAGTIRQVQFVLTAFAPPTALPFVVHVSNAAITAPAPGPYPFVNSILPGTITANSVTARTAVTVTYSLFERSVSKTITVFPSAPAVAPVLDSFTVSPSTIHPGASFTATATLTAVAPSGGLRVHLTQAGSISLVTLPDILIPAGAKRASVTIATPNIATPVPLSVTLTAAFDSVTRKAVLTIAP